MLDVVPALLIAAALAAALWFLQRRLFGPSGSRPRAALRLTAVILDRAGARRLRRLPALQGARRPAGRRPRHPRGHRREGRRAHLRRRPAARVHAERHRHAGSPRREGDVLRHRAATPPRRRTRCAPSWRPARRSATTPGRTRGCWRCPRERSPARSSDRRGDPRRWVRRAHLRAPAQRQAPARRALVPLATRAHHRHVVARAGFDRRHRRRPGRDGGLRARATSGPATSSSCT